MIGRIRFSLQGLLQLIAPRRSTRRPDGAQKEVIRGKKEVIRGSAGNVIIVKSPNTEYFKEAIFILCDDLFARRGVSSRELLDEARRAAEDCCGELVPPRDLTPWWHLVFFLLGAAACLLVLTLLKLF